MTDLYDIIKQDNPDLEFQLEYNGEEIIEGNVSILDLEGENIDMDLKDLIRKYNETIELEELKEHKKELILKVATITDQINAIGNILAEYVLVKPEAERSDAEKKGLEIFYNIKNIINN